MAGGADGLRPLTFDLHLDLAMSAIQYNRDLLLFEWRSRSSEEHIEGKSRGNNTVTLPEMRRGHVGLCVATVLARVIRGDGRKERPARASPATARTKTRSRWPRGSWPSTAAEAAGRAAHG